MNSEIDHVYVCHWTKLIDRKKHILNQLKLNKIDNFSFVELYDKDFLEKEKIQLIYPNVFNLIKREKRFLKLSEISLLLKHCWCVKDAFLKNYKSIMILEDDVIFCNNFNYYLKNFKKQLPDDWDCCWVGGCCGLTTKDKNDNTNVYKNKTSRCCHCYLLSNKCLNKINKEINNIDDAIDWYYNTLIPKLNLNSFWFEPWLAEQSSKFDTTVQGVN